MWKSPYLGKTVFILRRDPVHQNATAYTLEINHLQIRNFKFAHFMLQQEYSRRTKSVPRAALCVATISAALALTIEHKHLFYYHYNLTASLVGMITRDLREISPRNLNDTDRGRNLVVLWLGSPVHPRASVRPAAAAPGWTLTIYGLYELLQVNL